MLSCQSCLRRYVTALASVHAAQATAVPPLNRGLRAVHQASNPPPPVPSRDQVPLDGAEHEPQTKWSFSDQARDQARQVRAKLTERPKPSPVFSEADLRRELVYLQDPLKLADNVRNLLRRGQLQKAEALTITATKQMACTISWNHLINYHMEKGHVKQAFSCYNDMKKRAQVPDSYTYLLLLRGLADHAHYPNALEKALSLYHSMGTPKSPVKANIIHTNTVIKVCARSNDMDAMWGIVSKLAERGPGSADCLTYTLILGQLRVAAALDAPQGETDEQTARRRETLVVEGRQIWDDVVRRWRAGELFIDEKLTSAMGRLLLVGARPRDWDDVLSLIQQTMNVPRLIPRLGTGGRKGQIRAPSTPPDMKQGYSNPGDDVSRPGGEFDDVDSHVVGKSAQHASLAYAQPNNSTLSLILEACLKTRAKAPAKGYWDLLTDHDIHNIKPDLDNFHMYLRILRQTHSSAEVLALVRDELPRHGHTPHVKTFRIGLAACQRDYLNPAAIDHASRLLDIMQSRLPDPDVRCLLMYVELVQTATDPRTLVTALQRLQPSVINLRSFLNYGKNIAARDALPVREDALALLTRIVGLYDRLLRAPGLDPATVRTFEERRGKLGAYVARAGEEKRRKSLAWSSEVTTKRLRPSRGGSDGRSRATLRRALPEEQMNMEDGRVDGARAGEGPRFSFG